MGNCRLMLPSKEFGIPRRTLRDYILKKVFDQCQVGRKCILSSAHEDLLESRLLRLSEVGLPLTKRELCESAFLYCTEKKISYLFDPEKAMAGRKWCELFLKRHPILATRRAQLLNEARVQKLNTFIVEDYFEKLKSS